MTETAPKSRLRLIIPGLLLLAVFLAVEAAWLMRGESDGGLPAVSIGGPFSLVDQDGAPVTEASFRGKWMLVYFGYIHCPDACPTALNTMALALDAVGPRRGEIRPVFITIDPERDTAAVLKDYLGAFDAGITGLTGTGPQIAAAEKAFRVYATKHKADAAGNYDMDHSSVVYLLDPRGRFAASFTHESDPATIARKLKELAG